MLCIAALLILSSAHHPFVGENADASSIQTEDGSIAIRLSPTTLRSTKYDSIIDTQRSAKPRLSSTSRLVEAVFGKNQAKREFEVEVERFVEQKQRKAA